MPSKYDFIHPTGAENNQFDLTKHFDNAKAVLDKLLDNTKHISDKPKIVTSYGLDLPDYIGTKECIELFKNNSSVIVVGPDGSQYQCGKRIN